MNFLLEIGVEELPAEYARRAWEALASSRVLAEALGGEGRFEASGARHATYTPRRLAFVASGFAERHPDQELDVTGPAKKVAFDAEGKPTRALEGFLKGQGLTLEQIRFESTPKGEYVAARVTKKGAAVRDALAKAIPEAIAALPFPKTMRWEKSGARFARPIRWIVALLDGEPLELTFADVRAGSQSCGHRFFHPGFFDLAGLGRGESGAELLKTYLARLRGHGVLVSAEERRRIIRHDLERLCGSLGGRLVEDDELVDITADLVEWPAVVCGGFDAAYLALPPEVIITAMREHQRYFAAQDAAGRLLPNFLCVANASQAYFQARGGEESRAGLMRGLGLVLGAGEVGARAEAEALTGGEDLAGSEELDAALAPIARGNERVLRARLDDAKFYWDTDLARWQKNLALGPEGQAEPLRGLTWLEGWGTVYDKMGRVAALAERLGADFGLAGGEIPTLQRAAWLMKLDLTMEMIKDGKEFTSLEGRMGARYGESCGEAPEVTGPMAEHYLPKVTVTEEEDRRFLLQQGELAPEAEARVRAKLPTTPQARVLALLDKLDSVAGFFAAGRIPTGSEDPFGVRRIGNGLVALLLHMDRDDRGRFAGRAGDRAWEGRPCLRREHLEAALRGYGAKVDPAAAPAVVDQAFDFLVARLRAFLVGESTEAVNATLAAGFAPQRRVFLPLDAAARARQMATLLSATGTPREREDLYGLAVLFKRVSNILKEQQLDEAVSPPSEHSEPERKLLNVLDEAEPKVQMFYVNQGYQAALAELLRLRAPIDQFFLDVLVMDEDRNARDRRLKLLRRVQRLFLGGWDFSQVSVPASVS